MSVTWDFSTPFALRTSFIASVSVMLSFGLKVAFLAIYHAESAASIYLHPQSFVTSGNIPVHQSLIASPDSFITTFITSFLVIVASSLYSSGFEVLSAIIDSDARKLAASSSLIDSYVSLIA